MMGMGEIDGKPVRITHHAVQRMLEMELDAETFKNILFEPDVIVPSTKYPGKDNYVKGDHSLAVCEEGGVINIMTVVYATRAAWLRAHLAGKLAGDRDYYDNLNIPTF